MKAASALANRTPHRNIWKCSELSGNLGANVTNTIQVVDDACATVLYAFSSINENCAKKTANEAEFQLQDNQVDSFKDIFSKMLFTPSNSTTGFLLQTMLYVANITKHDLNAPKTREDFLLSPMGADSGKSNDSLIVLKPVHDSYRSKSVSIMRSLRWVKRCAKCYCLNWI